MKLSYYRCDACKVDSHEGECDEGECDLSEENPWYAVQIHVLTGKQTGRARFVHLCSPCAHHRMKVATLAEYCPKGANSDPE